METLMTEALAKIKPTDPLRLAKALKRIREEEQMGITPFSPDAI